MTQPTQEQWRPVVGYEGKYEVSDHGSLRSLDRLDSWGRKVRGRTLKPGSRPTGHRIMTLHKDGRPQTLDVHRLVLLAFVGPCPDGMEACHSNGDPADNRLENLRWDTRSSNQRDAVRHGTHARTAQKACKRGHPLTGGNLMMSITKAGSAGRSCKACHRELVGSRYHGRPFDVAQADENYLQVEAAVAAVLAGQGQQD